MSEAKKYPWKGKMYTVRELSEISGKPIGTMYSRIVKYQWDIEEAMERPIDIRVRRRVVIEYKPKPRVIPKPKDVCTARCKRCFYGSNDSGSVTCGYILEEYKRRGCPAGEKCTRFTTRKKRKPNNNGLIRMLRREA